MAGTSAPARAIDRATATSTPASRFGSRQEPRIGRRPRQERGDRGRGSLTVIIALPSASELRRADTGGQTNEYVYSTPRARGLFNGAARGGARREIGSGPADPDRGVVEHR